MRSARIRLVLVISTVVLILLSVFAESLYFSDFEYRFRTRRFNRILKDKEMITEECLDNIRRILNEGEDFGTITRSELFSRIEKENITLLYYLDNRLADWSDNSFEVPVDYVDSLFSHPIVFIYNGWFISKTSTSGNERIIALLRIRNDFGFENDLVRNGFTSVFKVPESTSISFDPHDKKYGIYNSVDEWLFSLVFPEIKEPTLFIVFPSILWSLSIISLILLICSFSGYFAEKGRPVPALIFGIASFMVTYSLLLIFHIPATFYKTELFSGYRFSANALIPSLGHFFLFSLFISLSAFLLYRYFPLKPLKSVNRAQQVIIISLLLITGVIPVIFFHSLFTQLVFDAGINFEPHRVLDLTAFSFIGFISVFLLALLPFFYILRIFTAIKHLNSSIIFISLAISLAGFVAAWFAGYNDSFIVALLYITVSVVAWFAMDKKISVFNSTVLLSLIFGLYSLYYIITLSEEKRTENKKVLAVSYSTEHDPEAEHLLLDLWTELSRDTVLKKILGTELTLQSDAEIRNYLGSTYFGGYWENFWLSTVSCRNDSPLFIESENRMVDNCFSYFMDRIKKYGHPLTGTGFYYLDDQGGRSYYMCPLFYDLGDNYSNGLFIELYGDVDAFQEGYSELLLDKKYQGYIKLKDYSFGKYINGNLVIRTGDFPYDKTDNEYIDKESEYRIFNKEGYNHVLYKNGNVTVIISEPKLSIVNIFVSFAYLFAFILFLTNLVSLVVYRPSVKQLLYLNFRQKLQIAFIGILLFSFISVGILTAFFSIRQYQTRHLETIKEKVTSIYIELENRLSLESRLLPDWRDASNPSLNDLLIKLSNVFNTDINLYDLNGILMATSRPEVFYRDLTGSRMNMDALMNLKYLTKSEYIQKEKIASLEYISAYVPFYNASNQLLAYLNLPYFRMQSVIAREISNVIVVVVNFTLLMIVLTMSLAVIIGGRLTSPLRMLSEGLASVELGKKGKHLAYKGQDEISDMVRQYNRMLDELQDSATKLANSEREFAWREMAKQVAHEIKNPLTPMKLNIQQLYKSWKDGIPGFDRKLESFTKNQIEYIETLSSIASAFSSFAKLPAAKPVEVNLTEQLKTTLDIFKDTEKIKFRIDWPTDCRIMVMADKEHLNGIFSNLIKNAIQSIPQDRNGIIRIGMTINGDKVTVSISDNGSGIPEDLKKNLFIPNFTTKSSGMGLGLSIVKRYVENAGGKVWFESEPGKGSTFFVELPVIYTVERLA